MGDTVEEKAARLRGTITFLLVSVLLLGGLLLYIATRTPQPARVATSAPVVPAPTPAPAGPLKYVWDGKWEHLNIPAGVGSYSDITPIDPDAEVYTEFGTGTDSPYGIECMARRQVNPDGYEQIPCGGFVHFFRLVNKTDSAVDARWHPGPIVASQPAK